MSSIEYKLEQMAYSNTSRQMTWQTNMSNTSHQREVKDLVAAGLNPVLSSGGQGAQSYTTSVDSAVNAIGNIAASREAAAATRYAARQSAAATRAAAAAQLQAAKYGADVSKYGMDLQAGVQKYVADKNYEAAKYKADTSFIGIIRGAVNNPASAFSIFKPFASQLKNVQKNPTAYFNKQNATKFGDLNYAGRMFCYKVIRKTGYSINNPTAQRIVFRAMFLNDNYAKKKLTNWINSYYKQNTTAARNVVSKNQTGSGVW